MNFHDHCKLTNCAAAEQHVNQISIIIEVSSHNHLATARMKNKW